MKLPFLSESLLRSLLSSEASTLVLLLTASTLYTLKASGAVMLKGASLMSSFHEGEPP